MHTSKLLMITLVAAFFSCNTATDNNRKPQASFDLNTALAERRGDSITYRQHEQINVLVDSVIRNRSIAASLAMSQDGVPCMVLARTEPGKAEIHEQVDDIAIIRSGHGILKTGYSVTGKITTNDQEPSRNWFCEGIKDATERKLSPGDLVLIPAMVAHQYIPDPGDTLTYWTIKVKTRTANEKD